MIDWPSNPSAGQIYNPGTGPIYIWDGVAWNLATSQTRTARQKNLLVNPTMQVSQENGNTAVGSGGYPADQWLLLFSGFSAGILRAQGLITPDNSQYTLTQSFSTVVASPAAGDYCQIIQAIEGLRMADLEWGTAKAIPAVLRFNAACETAGTYTVVVTNADNTQTWLGAFTCDGSQNVKTFSYAIPARAVGTWAKDSTVGGSVRFCSAVGSTYGGGVAGWQAANKIGIAGQTNGATIIGKNLIIGDVGLYADPDNTGLPPPFITPEYVDDLLRCQRYWRAMTISRQPIGSAIYAGGTWPLAPHMRTNPTISYRDLSGNPNKVSTGSGANVTFTGGFSGYYDNVAADGTLPASQTYWWACYLAINSRM